MQPPMGTVTNYEPYLWGAFIVGAGALLLFYGALLVENILLKERKNALSKK